MTREQALKLIDRMPYIPAIQAPNDKVRMELYKVAIDTNDPLEWIKVIKSCYVRTHGQSGKRLIVSKQEAQCGKSVKKLLEAELAKALDIDDREVEAYIVTYLAENL